MEIPFNPIRRWHLTISRCQKTPVGVDVELLGELKTELDVNVVMLKGDPVKKRKEYGNHGFRESQHFNEKTVRPISNWTLKTGDNLSLYTSTDWDKTCEHEIILFAHVNPTQKLQIVQEAQKRKKTVTFAGINSISAIAAADIGIAFSDISTNFVQNVAGIVITDNFSLILKGIEQSCQINPKTDIMKLSPRNQKKRLIPCSLFLYAYGFVGIAMALGCFGAYLSVFWYHGFALKDLVLTSEDFWNYDSKNLTISSGNIFNGNQQVFIRQQASAAWQGTLILAQVRNF
uniref:Uncharacterized protein n=1 Tax=Panagrolaimus davidi TaxID=227884 RepID=A0A914QCB4_9BILA